MKVDVVFSTRRSWICCNFCLASAKNKIQASTPPLPRWQRLSFMTIKSWSPPCPLWRLLNQVLNGECLQSPIFLINRISREQARCNGSQSLLDNSHVNYSDKKIIEVDVANDLHVYCVLKAHARTRIRERSDQLLDCSLIRHQRNHL